MPKKQYDYQVEKGHPVPKPGHRGGYNQYPWEAMKIGDSFFADSKTITSMSSVAVRAAKSRGTKYTCRTELLDGVPGVRVWRVK